MCGILGFFSAEQGRLSRETFQSALNRLAHRGPDSEGIRVVRSGILGHRRLSIIDLSEAGNQPFKLPDEDFLQIVFNGEIYNYRDLRSRLSGVSTQSDTEVILRGYAEKGLDFLKSLRGMYAFSIYDARERERLLLYRDPAGIKPLYYLFTPDYFIFSSELKAIIPLADQSDLGIDSSVIKAYLSIGYCPEPYTVYKNIKALEPGHVLEIDIDKWKIQKRALSTYSTCAVARRSGDDPLPVVRNLLQTAVARNVVGDVPIKFALSGGIDSSLIVAMAMSQGLDPETLTVSFKDRVFDEVAVAKVYQDTLKVRSEYITCEVDESLPLLRRLLLHFDQPYADSSLVPFYFLSRAASTACKVLIGGDGGDEIQAGYENFRALPRVRKFRSFYWLSRLASVVTSGDSSRKFKKLSTLLSTGSDYELMFLKESWIYPEMSIQGEFPFKFDIEDGLSLYKSCFENVLTKGFDDRLLVDVFYKRMLSDYMRKADMMSMINSLEYRVPMLDEDLVAYSFSIPRTSKIGFGKGKALLRRLHGEFYPEKTTNLPKQGFSIPLDTWLSAEEFEEMRSYILEGGILGEFVNINYVRKLFESLYSKGSAHEISRSGIYQQILIFYSLQLWYKEGRR